MAEESKQGNIRYVGFCGADDSVQPNMLGIIARAYPFVEFGVLFRPDKEGKPRYATPEFVDQLKKVATSQEPNMRLAAHLCGSRVNQVLRGDDSFLASTIIPTFQRIQINATAVNGVDTSRLAESVEKLMPVMSKYASTTEFIIQKNDETKPLWEGLLRMSKDNKLPSNVSMLVDESKGTGVQASSWPAPTGEYAIGYAGGIGPANVSDVLSDLHRVTKGERFWIDMESGLRSDLNGADVFDLHKCYQVIEHVVNHEKYALTHPSYLPSSSSTETTESRKRAKLS